MSSSNDDLRQFMLVLRQALLTIVAWIEKRYGLRRSSSSINASASNGPGETDRQ